MTRLRPTSPNVSNRIKVEPELPPKAARLTKGCAQLNTLSSIGF